MAAHFPYVAVSSGRGDAYLAPMLPMALQFESDKRVEASGLVDSGAAVNVLPYRLGLELGAIWDAQTTSVTLSGNLAAHDARAVLLQAHVADFKPVRLVFAWSQSDNVPLLLGQVNFFDEFDVSFFRLRRRFEIGLAQK